MDVTVSMNLNLTPRSLSVLALAKELAAQQGCPAVGAEHIALAMLADGEGLAAKALQACGATREKLEQHIKKLTTE